GDQFIRRRRERRNVRRRLRWPRPEAYQRAISILTFVRYNQGPTAACGGRASFFVWPVMKAAGRCAPVDIVAHAAGLLLMWLAGGGAVARTDPLSRITKYTALDVQEHSDDYAWLAEHIDPIYRQISND